MEKINRLGWTAGISFTAYGRRIGVRVNDATLLGRVRELLPFGSREVDYPTVERLYSVYVGTARGGKVRPFHLLYQDGALAARTPELAVMMDSFTTNLRSYVAEHARRRVFIHAGVVGWQGRAILIPGRSFSGKSTLVAELMRAGARYYSDEYAVLDERGRVHPFLKPVSLRNGGFEQTEVPAARIGRSGKRPLPVGLVVVTRYLEGTRWRPRAVSAGQGVLEMVANAVAVRHEPERTLATLELALRGARVLKGARGDAREEAAAILEAVG